MQRYRHIGARCATSTTPRLRVKPNGCGDRKAWDACGTRTNHEIDSCLRWYGWHDRIGGATKRLHHQRNIFKACTEVRRLAHVWNSEASRICERLKSIPGGGCCCVLWTRTCATQGHDNRRATCSDAQARFKGKSGFGARTSKNEDRCARGGGARCDATLRHCQCELGDRVAPACKQLFRCVAKPECLRFNSAHCGH